MSDADARTSPARLQEERREAAASHSPDRAPTVDEEEAADRSRRQFSDGAAEVAEHEQSAAQCGANI